MNRKIETRLLDARYGQEWPMPSYATAGSAAIDLRASIEGPAWITPGEKELLGTGVAVHIADPALAGIVASRSGLALKHGIRVAQGIGVIDSDYTGEIKVMLRNDGDRSWLVQPGERIAQLLFMPVEQVELQVVEEITEETKRGAGGFGHTGEA